MVFGMNYTNTAYNGFRVGFDDATNVIDIDDEVTGKRVTTAAFRDPSAWYHIVIAVDTTQATDADRMIIYVNGARQATSTTSSIPQNQTWFSSAPTAYFGVNPFTGNNWYYSGYCGDCYFIDGQTLAASSFGQTDTTSGQWIPKEYGGTYGTNGCYLKFANSGNLGLDSSPNGNSWTPNNFNTHDQVLDSPTNNFCTLNPLDMQSSISVAEGGLKSVHSGSGAGPNMVRATSAIPSSGKWYFEANMITDNSDSGIMMGLMPFGTALLATGGDGVGSGEGCGFQKQGYFVRNGSWVTNSTNYTAGDYLQVAVDMDSAKVWFGKNGTWINGGSPSADTTPAFTGVANSLCPAVQASTASGVSWRVNFGQGGQSGLTYDAASGGRFKYTPPAGFKALSAANLPTPTIKNGGQYFNALAYSGNGNTSRSFTGLGFQPGLVWIKCRTVSNAHTIFDSVRGANLELSSNYMDSETGSNTNAAYGKVTSFDTDGFTAQQGSVGFDRINLSGTNNYVAWCWKAGGAAVSNTTGTITSQVSANFTAGFNIVTFSGGGSGGTVGHGLGTTPAMCIFKARNNIGTTGWNTWHQNLTGSNYYLDLSSTGQQSNAASNFSGTWTSTTFGLTATPLASGANLVAYLWAEVPGFSKFGSYTGNGSADGPFVYCGFKPRFLLIKHSSNTGSWFIIDTVRGDVNPIGNSSVTGVLIADASSNEAGLSGGYAVDVLSNGFKIRNSSNAFNLSTSDTYIFAAFAEAPFKYATAK
jgi:hypothetical protein